VLHVFRVSMVGLLEWWEFQLDQIRLDLIKLWKYRGENNA